MSVLAENPMDESGVWIFPGKVSLDDTQLNYLNSLNMDTLSGAVTLGKWFTAHGAYAPNAMFQLVLKNERSYLVRILDVTTVKDCKTPLKGTLFYSPAEGVDEDANLYFDLDSANPQAFDPTASATTEYFADRTISIAPGGQQVFRVWAATREHACSFYLQFEIIDDNRTVYETVGDGPQPFRISAYVIGSYHNKPYAAYLAAYPGGDFRPGGPRQSSAGYVEVNPKTFSYDSRF